MGRRNLVGAAPTGSGKTLAFLLPILNSMLQKKDEETEDDLAERNVQAIIVTPTRGKLSGNIPVGVGNLLSTMTNIRLHFFRQSRGRILSSVDKNLIPLAVRVDFQM
jgi:hypothetical protein